MRKVARDAGTFRNAGTEAGEAWVGGRSCAVTGWVAVYGVIGGAGVGCPLGRTMGGKRETA